VIALYLMYLIKEDECMFMLRLNDTQLIIYKLYRFIVFFVKMPNTFYLRYIIDKWLRQTLSLVKQRVR